MLPPDSWLGCILRLPSADVLIMTCFVVDTGNDGASDDSSDKVGEIRFVPEDKSRCKIKLSKKNL